MKSRTIKYKFQSVDRFIEVEGALILAQLAVECLKGRSELELDADCEIDREARCVQIDASTEVGYSINKLFLGFIQREFDRAEFTIHQFGGQTPRCNWENGRYSKGSTPN